MPSVHGSENETRACLPAKNSTNEATALHCGLFCFFFVRMGIGFMKLRWAVGGHVAQAGFKDVLVVNSDLELQVLLSPSTTTPSAGATGLWDGENLKSKRASHHHKRTQGRTQSSHQEEGP